MDRAGTEAVSTRPRTGAGADLAGVAAGVLLVVAAAVVGRMLLAAGADLLLPFPPLLAEWLPHAGPGTPVAVVTAAVAVVWGPSVAATLRWGRLLAVAWAAATVWTLGLALVDGWQRGVVERLSSGEEYLHDVPQVDDARRMLATFADHILTDQPVHWTTHVGAHPPGVLLFYVVLDRLGLGGGGPSGVVTVLVGASACVAVAVALRALAAEDVARRAVPFGVLLPGAVWVGVSADGMFAAVLAWGVALLAIGATGRGARGATAAVAGGVLLGATLYLSYGLALGLLLPAAVVLATRAWRAAALAVAGAALVAAAFTAAGFWWPTGFSHVRVIYAASIAAARPYSYFVWANLAAVSFAVGPAVYAGVRRAVASGRTGALPRAAALLVLAALAAIVVADLTGLSKAEVERIWLPFAVWLVIPCALLPRPRPWLAAQALLALAVNHLLLTVW
ncbi:MAG: methylthioxylose transferase [Pseudonocardiales bacterium]|nr:methylthioxylose transferase [Pseudonocardiales bacterium]